jgi:hypothetical protein
MLLMAEVDKVSLETLLSLSHGEVMHHDIRLVPMHQGCSSIMVWFAEVYVPRRGLEKRAMNRQCAFGPNLCKKGCRRHICDESALLNESQHGIQVMITTPETLKSNPHVLKML